MHIFFKKCILKVLKHKIYFLNSLGITDEFSKLLVGSNFSVITRHFTKLLSY